MRSPWLTAPSERGLIPHHPGNIIDTAGEARVLLAAAHWGGSARGRPIAYPRSRLGDSAAERRIAITGIDEVAE
jgi:hypothetical protein